MNERFSLKVDHRLFHNSPPTRLAEMTCTRLGRSEGFVFDSVTYEPATGLCHLTPSVMREVIEKQLRNYLTDRHFAIFWDEDTGITTTVTSL